MNEETTSRITQVATVGVRVTGQDRALGFFGTSGFDKCLDVCHGDRERWVEVAPIALVPAREATGRGHPSVGSGGIATAGSHHQ